MIDRRVRFAAWDRARDLAPRIARVALLFAALYAGALVWTAYRARADVREIMFGVGAEMMRFGDAQRQSAPRALSINGQRIWMATAASRTMTVGQALDVFEARCKARDGSLALPSTLDAAARERFAGVPLDTTLRFEDGIRGVVGCIDTGSDTLSVTEVAERLRAFADTGDFISMGGIRYAYIERTNGETYAITFWTDGSFNVDQAFPREGDAPGHDIESVPRPRGSRRVLSAWQDGEPQTVTHYAFASEDRATLARFYETQLASEGWTLSRPDPSRVPGPRRSRAIVLLGEREGRAIFVVVDEDRNHRGSATVFTAR